MRRVGKTLSALSVYRLVQLMILVVLAGAFVTSFKSGASGALKLGYPDEFKFAFPLVCDVVAATATVVHGQVNHDKQMRRICVWFAMVPMMLSWAANAIDHVYAAQAAARGWEQPAQIAWFTGVIVMAGVCPSAVAALLYLATKYTEYQERQNAKAAAKAEKKATGKDKRVDTAPKATSSNGTAPKHAAMAMVHKTADDLQAHRGEQDQRVTWLTELESAAPEMTYSEKLSAIQDRFSVSERTAKRVVAGAKEAAS